MSTAAELKTKLEALRVDVAENRVVIDSAKVLLNGLNALNAELKQKIADLIAAGGGDPAALQAILDEMNALGTAIDEGTADLATALVAGTPGGPEATSSRTATKR